MRKGDVFIHDQPGPGGWGDPLQRDPARVLRDVLNELVSLASARDDYGVVIDAAPSQGSRSTPDRSRSRTRRSRPLRCGWRSSISSSRPTLRAGTSSSRPAARSHARVRGPG